MNDGIFTVMFYLAAIIAVTAAWGVIYCKNLVHSALFLALCFIAVAGLYALLNADFLAAVQIMVYAGTVVILIVLGIMMTRRVSMDRSNVMEKSSILGAAVVSLLLLVCLLLIFLNVSFVDSAVNDIQDTVGALAQLLLTHYVLAFEIAAVLLLSAMIGAIVLAKGADEK
ncbi:NADH-quinone oxidoreductase subunit J [Pectinatus frisingensis]|jgi:NADH-quinone oxidoreductase subunit J|uniref:NADH-quinone oxidoreductase subunit J family protein n=1 Tax=Pectinatus frisingensis TaxID=865 RepID=UPI0015F5D544|nr:NADH-quinone oxidoreductase subunit J [Pectinatus frisingensis]